VKPAARATSAAREPNRRRADSQRKTEKMTEWKAAASRIPRSPAPSRAVVAAIVQAARGGWSKYERASRRLQVQ
jgi:hypothetical protein